MTDKRCSENDYQMFIHVMNTLIGHIRERECCVIQLNTHTISRPPEESQWSSVN